MSGPGHGVDVDALEDLLARSGRIVRRRDLRRSGVGRRAVQRLVRDGVLRPLTPHLFTDVANTASQRVAERAGFRREGVVRRCLAYRDGRRADAVLFGRLPEG